ncbi:MAG: hypothetical protein ACK526_03995 [Planctomyces sp.]
MNSGPDPSASPSDGAHPKDDAASDSGETPLDRSTADIAIVCAHSGEVRPFLKRLDRQRKYSERGTTFRGGFLGELLRVAVITPASGFAAHRLATETLIREHRPAWVFSVGFSSGLAEEVRSGDLVVASEIVDTHGNSMPVKCSIPGRKRIHVGRLLVADSHPLESEAKQALFREHSALAVDTTSLAVAQICAETNTRFLCIRSIVDEVAESVSPQAATFVFESGSRAAGKTLGAVIQSFSRISELNAWRTRSANAADHLDRFLTGIVEQLGEKIVERRF